MGLHQSKQRQQQQQQQTHSVKDSKNDYELVIRAAKELEYILEHDFEAQGRGLHAKISNAANLRSCHNHGIHVFSNQHLQDMRYVASIRQKLIHEHGFDVPMAPHHRIAFEEAYTRSLTKLQQEVLVITNKNNDGTMMHRGGSGVNGHFRKAPTASPTTTAMQKRRQRPRRYDPDDDNDNDVDPFLIGCGGGGGGGVLNSCIIC